MADLRKKKTTMMTEGVIWKQLIAFAVPLLFGNLLQQLYNTVDSIVVGQFIGSDALAAVSSSNSLINMIIGMFLGIATGAGVIISQYYGARNEQKMQDAVLSGDTYHYIGLTFPNEDGEAVKNYEQTTMPPASSMPIIATREEGWIAEYNNLYANVG